MLNEKFAVLIQKLAERQQSDGGFSFWPGGYHSADFPSIYAMHFLLAAREQGLAVPDYLYQQGLEYLRRAARQELVAGSEEPRRRPSDVRRG